MASIGITPTMLCDALRKYRQEFEGVLSIDLYDSGQEWEGVIVHMPEYSWVIGIHGQDPAWDSNGYLDWSIYKTGIEDGKLYLDEYLGMGVANDSAGWSLEKVVAKICQVIRGGAMPSIPDGFQVGDWVIYSCYPHVYEGTAVVVPEGVEAIGPTRHALGEDMSPVCLWENIYEVRHVREYDGMWYENIFEKYPPEGLTVNRPNLRYEGTIIRG